jgi:hypothetical protein
MNIGVIVVVRYRKYSSRDIPMTISLRANSAGVRNWKRYSPFLHLLLRTVVELPEPPVVEDKSVVIRHHAQPEEGAEKTESDRALAARNSDAHPFCLA